MIKAFKDFVRHHWPALRLRTILFVVLFITAATPGVSAIFLRVYENALVRRTEGELMAQGAALVATASAIWPGVDAPPAERTVRDSYRAEPTTIDLHASKILEDRPPPRFGGPPPDADAVAVGAILDPIFRQTNRTTVANIVLLDRNGRIAQGTERGGDLSGVPEVRAALAGHPRTALRRYAGYASERRWEWISRAADIRLHHARPVLIGGQVKGVILLDQSPRALFKGVYEDRGKIFLGVVGVLILLVVLTNLISRTITRPVEALSAAIKGVAAGKDPPLEPPAIAAVEIQDLYEDFRLMAEAIRRRSRYLRDFAAAVSHEFKTPLAAITGAVELLQDHGATMSREERLKFLDNISSDTARLTRLVGSLLDMARADMAQPEAFAQTDLARCIVAVAAGFDSRAVIATHAQPNLPAAGCPEGTVERVLTTLIDNSLQAGASRIEITAAREEDRLVVAIADNGPGVAEADRERLFEPFFTTRRASGGAGLGLPIARSLLEASQGTLRLAPSAKGARFEITLPRARP